MSAIDLIFAIFALATIGVAVLAKQWRPILWVGAICLSYGLSDIAWRSHLGPVEAATVTGLGDAAICLSVYFLWRQAWELWIWRLYQVSVGFSAFYAASLLGIAPSFGHNAYATMLEVINALAFLGMFGANLVKWIETLDGPVLQLGRRFHGLGRALYRDRTALPFTHRQR